jgi:hypothetical protein
VNFAAAPTASWTTRADKSTMLKVYSDFCPPVMRMLALAPEGEVCEWKLRVHRFLNTWVEGNVALLGDACHPTLPVRAVVSSSCPELTISVIQHLGQVRLPRIPSGLHVK